MRIEIITVNDESFAIYPPSNNVEETPAEEVPIVEVEQVVEETPQPPVERCVSIENPKESNSFDWFSGTSWGGKKQGF